MTNTEQTQAFQRELDKARTRAFDAEAENTCLKKDLEKKHSAEVRKLDSQIAELQREVERRDIKKITELEAELAEANKHHSGVLTDLEEEVARTTKLEEDARTEALKLQNAEMQVGSLRKRVDELEAREIPDPPKPSTTTRIRRSQRT